MSFGPCWLHTPPERVNTHAAPSSSLSPGPPISAVLPSAESATSTPNWLLPSSPPVSFGPCWLHIPPERVNTHTAPVAMSSSGPADQRGVAVFGQRNAVAEFAFSALARPVSFAPCWVQVEPVRSEHPRRAGAAVVGRPADQRRVAVGGERHACAEFAFSGLAAALVGALPVQSPTSFSPCWVQADPERVNTHAAPTPPLSAGPPINAVSPSAESATLLPNSPFPVSPLPSLAQLPVQSPTSFSPCWVQVDPERVNTHAAPA